MLDGADRSRRGHQAQQQLLALDQRERSQIVVLEGEQIEKEQRRGQLGGGLIHVSRRRQQRALLQPLEDGPAGIVQHHDLSVGDESFRGQREQRARQVGKYRGRVRAAPVEDSRTGAVPADDGAKPVVLQLEQPLGIVERIAARLGEHRLQVIAGDGPPRRLQPPADGAQLRGALAAFAQLLHRQPGKDR